MDPKFSASRPVVGIIANNSLLDGQFEIQASASINSRAIAQVAECVPMIIPADPKLVSVPDLMKTCDGFLFTGARANVHPEEYGVQATKAHGDFDRERDAVSLPLIRACVEAGQPILGMCRGFQEINVAMGGSLDPEIRDLPGRMNHRMPPDGTLEEKFALRHAVHFQEGGVFADLLGSNEVMTNTLHGQGINKPGARVVVDGRAQDDTPEAIFVDGAPGFALAVQWHAEWEADRNEVSTRLFVAFGNAVRAWSSRPHPGAE